MNNAQNEFYSSVAEYYHEIFPFNQVQLKYVEKHCGGLSGKKILDIGCATGELAFELAKAGAEVTAIDLNEDLLHRARMEKEHTGLNFQKGDMMKLNDYFQPRQFDAVVCFGNTLVHLPSENHIREFLVKVKNVLMPGCPFLIQILNYDYILEEGVSELPVIETSNIKFLRRYRFKPESHVIGFKTELHLKKEGKVIANETPLLALRSKILVKLLKEASFENVMLFANFKEDMFGGSHLPLVAKAVRGQ